MRKLAVIDFLSLDGVMQAPGQPDEDIEGGFKHGGWAIPYHDETLAASVAENMAATDAYLFGRKTYENFAAYWPTAPRDIPFTDHLNNTAKYVVSTTLKDPDWNNSTVIDGDVVEEVHKLKEQPGEGIAVLGSGALVQTLIEHDLVDEYFLTIYPLVLGGGKRLFRDDEQLRRLELVNSKTTGTGGVVLTYRPVREQGNP
ncbi:MAG: dihydrofolate reductase family protein [Actinomycetota bacterium]|nr:dihydrofolate reductase family protein [Actinomycetota bacterium]